MSKACNTLFAFATLLYLGCGSADPGEIVSRVNKQNIQRLANLYLTYQSKNSWQGPSNEADLRTFVENYNPKKLSRIGVALETLDDLFISERDGEPFKIRYSVPGSIRGSSEPVIFEATGSGDGRMVGFLNMEQRVVDDAEYEQLWNNGSP